VPRQHRRRHHRNPLHPGHDLSSGISPRNLSSDTPQRRKLGSAHELQSREGRSGAASWPGSRTSCGTNRETAFLGTGTNNARPQVLRYSALGLGVFYGFYHQRTINSSQKAAAAQREFEHKQKLINQAKEAYAKTKAAPSATAGKEGESSLPTTVHWARVD
jgi:F-type H+-transporting ATP synthase subunit e